VNTKNFSLIIFISIILFIGLYTIRDKTVVEKIALEDFELVTPKLTENEKKFGSLFQNLNKEMNSLKKNSYFKNFVKDKADKIKVENLFLEIVKKIPELHQLRYIYKDGKEIIRAQRDQDLSFIVEEKKLQNKKHRYYFTNIMKSTNNQMWLSKIDDNIEHNVIPLPNEKTLRVGIQVLVDEVKEGILVANIKMDKLNIHEGEFLQSFRVDTNKNIYIGY